MWVEAPHFVVAGRDSADWKGESDNAWISKDGARIGLAGAVEMHRDAQGKIKTARWRRATSPPGPRTRNSETAADTVMTQPGVMQRGTGMKADPVPTNWNCSPMSTPNGRAQVATLKSSPPRSAGLAPAAGR